MLRHFIITLFSSWLLSPLGILIVQFLGLGQDSVLLMYLFGVSTCVPFQLLMNECLASGQASERFHSNFFQLFIVLFLQLVSCVTTLLILPHREFDLVTAIVLSALLSISTFLSYCSAVMYYQQALKSLLSTRKSILVGALPGIVAFFIYTAYGGAKYFWPALPSEYLIVIAVLPAVIQWGFIKKMVISSKSEQEELLASNISGDSMAVSSVILFSALFGLIAITIASTALRDIIVGHSQYAALMMVSLNFFASMANTLTRVSFFSARTKQLHQKFFLCAGIVSLLSTLLLPYQLLLAHVLVLFAAQLGVVAIIEAARKYV